MNFNQIFLDYSLRFALHVKNFFYHKNLQKLLGLVFYKSICFGYGLSEKIWTSDLLNPIQARYQTAPHPVT